MKATSHQGKTKTTRPLEQTDNNVDAPLKTEITPVGCCTLSEKGLILEANPAAAILLGMTNSELVKQPLNSFIPKDDQAIYNLLYKKLIETGEPQECELRMIKPGDAVFWARLLMTTAEAEGGAQVCHLLLSDITEQMKSRDELAAMANEWQTTFDAASDAIWLIDSDHRIVRANKMAEEMFQHPSGTCVGQHCFEIVHGTLEPISGCPFVRARISLRRETMDLSIGKGIYEVTAYPVLDSAGSFLRMVHVISDITERKRAEIALHERVKELGAFYHLSTFAASPTMVLDELYQEMANVLPQSWQYPEVTCARIVIGDREFSSSNFAESRWYQTEVIQVNDSVAGRIDVGYLEEKPKEDEGPFLKEERQLIRAIAERIGHITQRELAEEERENLQSQLNQAMKMELVGQLAGGVAHDFNNMLGVILGRAEMAMENLSPTESMYVDLDEIKKAAQRSADLTRQLLTFARKQPVDLKVLDLNETLASMLKLLHRLISEDIELVWKPGSDLWPVRTDPTQIDQILTNLCVNAKDAIDGVGKVTIGTSNVSLEECDCAPHFGCVPGDYVLLVVSDNGGGMDAETVSHVFEPFFTTKAIGHGTGLGLATVYGAVKQNNGLIKVQSEPGQGTTFKIYLPRYMAEAAEIQEHMSHTAASGNETILLVEDDPTLLSVATIMLKKLGYTVLVATNTDEAIQLVQEHAGRIDLLMTDVVMPKMNGVELSKSILSLHPHMKCLFMSGYSDIEDEQGVLERETNFIQKPYSLAGLSKRLREVLNG